MPADPDHIARQTYRAIKLNARAFDPADLNVGLADIRGAAPSQAPPTPKQPSPRLAMPSHAQRGYFPIKPGAKPRKTWTPQEAADRVRALYGPRMRPAQPGNIHASPPGYVPQTNPILKAWGAQKAKLRDAARTITLGRA